MGRLEHGTRTGRVAIALSEVGWKDTAFICYVESEAICHDDGKKRGFAKTVFRRKSLPFDFKEAAKVRRLLHTTLLSLEHF